MSASIQKLVMWRKTLILIISWIPLLLAGQEFMHYGITDGLSGIEVNDIKQNENFLWIATSDGLNRFDGENFKVYKRENGTENSLNGNNIETLFFDSDGFLWIGLKTGGVDIYDARHDKFRHLSQLINGPLPTRVISIFEDSKKNIWLGTWEEGVYKLIPEGPEKHPTRQRYTILALLYPLFTKSLKVLSGSEHTQECMCTA